MVIYTAFMLPILPEAASSDLSIIYERLLMQLHHQYLDDFDYVFTDFNDLENYDILVNVRDSDFKLNGHFSNDFYYILVHLDDFEHHRLSGAGKASRFMTTRQTIITACYFIVDSYDLDNTLVHCIDYDSAACLLYDLDYDSNYSHTRPS